MIKKLKTKFILLTSAAVLVLLILLVAGMNILNYLSVARDADEILSDLSLVVEHFSQDHSEDNKKAEAKETEVDENGKEEIKKKPIRDNEKKNSPARTDHVLKNSKGEDMPRFIWDQRYFSVVVNDDEIIDITFKNTFSITVEEAKEYVLREEITEKNIFVGRYRRLCEKQGDSTRIIFLDCAKELRAFKDFLIASIVMASLGFLVVFAVIFMVSGKITQNMAQNIQRQKQFITNAGHELKTPLTVIKTNLDLLEIEAPDDESVQDIRFQINRLEELTKDLVALTRIEENDKLPMSEFPFSDLVLETATAFKSLAISQEKNFSCNIEPNITFNGNTTALKHLLDIILDNSIKYCNEKGHITLTLEKKNKQIILCACNTTDMLLEEDEIKFIFDRFYRADSSRSSEIKGYGIGLSLAQGIVDSHKGKISASVNKENCFILTITFPTN
ncbi:MAG: HAMP domain-containing histidine kinase [Ruminococcaceae bacterium]|nr:HAMP domain-containing histidine kinase [Oscillospiraceae bacterium]